MTTPQIQVKHTVICGDCGAHVFAGHWDKHEQWHGDMRALKSALSKLTSEGKL